MNNSVPSTFGHTEGAGTVGGGDCNMQSNKVKKWGKNNQCKKNETTSTEKATTINYSYNIPSKELEREHHCYHQVMETTVASNMESNVVKK